MTKLLSQIKSPRVCQFILKIKYDEHGLSGIAFDIYHRYTFEFIKAVSDTVLDAINAVYHDKPLVFIRAIRLNLSRLFLTLY